MAEEDFTSDPQTSAPPPSVSPGPEYDPAQHREWVRGFLAGALLFILFFVVVAAFATIWFGKGANGALSDLMKLIFAPLVALVGAATGFYYGTRER